MSVVTITESTKPSDQFVPPDEDRVGTTADDDTEYRRLLERLCTAAVNRRYEAYRDIAWDDPDMAVDPDDPRWELAADHPLGATEWYRAQPAGVRSRIGLNLTAGFMYTGRVFEGVLCRGLIAFATTQPHDSLEYRFALHEVIEESHHSLMFQEFVNRAGLPVPVVDAGFVAETERVAAYGATFPELLFVYALGGEDPIDHVQREAHRKSDGGHPLTRRISQIHIVEEARHTAFARGYLRRNVPKLDDERRGELAVTIPGLLGVMAAMMMQPPQHIIDTYDIPPAVIDEAYTDNPVHRELLVAALAKIRALCTELGLLNADTEPLWRDAGLLPD